MAVIKVTVTVEKISNVLTQFDVIKVYRSTAGEGGPYSEITGPGTRIPLLAGQTVYTYDDTAGDPTYYYKTSYYHETTTLESSLSDAILGDADSMYTDIDAIRAEGVTVAKASDDKILQLIRVWQRNIEAITRNWFVPRQMTWEMDGNGTTLLQLPVPIISVASVSVDGESVSADAYRVYNGRGESGRDDRKNPRIKLLTAETSIFAGTGQVRRRVTLFEVGEKNVEVEGVFGYVEPDGSTPAPIVYALKKLVVRGCSPMAGSSGALPAGPVIEEETDRHRRKWADPFVSTKVWSSTGTGDLEVDQILASFRSPFSIKAPRTLHRRMTGGQVLT